MPSADVVVIGAGLAGLTAAIELAERGADALGVPGQFVGANPSSYAWPTDERPTGPAAWPLQAGAPGYVPAGPGGAAPFRALPGGRRAPDEDTPEATALRESAEEIGLAPGRVRLLGRLNAHDTHTGYRVLPVVGLVESPLDLEPDPSEPKYLVTVRGLGYKLDL